MSATVINLNDRRPGLAARPIFVDAIACVRCRGDTFKLFAEGHIRCTGCGDLMKNLSAVLT